jgi:hypothetical protein
LFIEGYYVGNGLMDNYGVGGSLFINGLSPAYTDADSVIISLMDAMNYLEVDRQTGILQIDGSVSILIGSNINIGNAYYIRLMHRNAIETWSANPVQINHTTFYDFTSSQSNAYGNNMIQTFDQMGWAIYSGDISDQSFGLGYQDGIIEGQDYSDMENAVYFIKEGYVPEDISGDGVVEGMDYSIMENNVYYIIYSIRPY